MTLRRTATVLFFGYVILLIVAGGWGMLFGDVDQWWLLGMHLDAIPDEQVRANVVSQYRFLRAVELGFGVSALRYRQEIFAGVGFYTLFLPVMVLGVGARLVSIAVDGWPHPIFLAFMALEAAGAATLYATISKHRRLRGQPA